MTSGSQKRRKSEHIKVNCTPEEKEAVLHRADASGQSSSALCLNTLLGIPLPRVRRPRVDNQALAQFLAANARACDAVKASLASLGKPDSNVNQIAHHLNAGRPGDRIMGMVEATLQEHRDARELHHELLRDFLELRTLGMKALGLEPERNS